MIYLHIFRTPKPVPAGSLVITKKQKAQEKFLTVSMLLFQMQQNNRTKVAFFSKMSPNTTSGASYGFGVKPTSQFQASATSLLTVEIQTFQCISINKKSMLMWLISKYYFTESQVP